MSVNEVCYITREEVQATLEGSQNTRAARDIDNRIMAASRDIEGIMHRRFYPWKGTRYQRWPNTPASSGAWRIWLDQDELLEVTGLFSGTTEITAGNYYLEPANDGPPYTSIEVNTATVGGWTTGASAQRNISITGTFGYTQAEQPAGALAANAVAAATSFDLTDGSAVGIGDLVRCGTERFLVTGKLAVDTGQTLGTGIDAKNSTTAVSVANGSEFSSGEFIVVGTEQMQVLEVLGNTLAVKRAVGGAVLAAHSSGAPVYALRRVQVLRGQVGTTAADHNDGEALFVHRAPSLIREATLAVAVNYLLQGSSGYARTVGSGDNQRESGGRGVRQIVDDAYVAYGRKGRIGVA